MKQIEVTDEMYDFLMNLSKELHTQDNRSTAMPYFFQVMEEKTVAAYTGSGDKVYRSSKFEVELREDSEKLKFIKDHLEYFSEFDREDAEEVNEDSHVDYLDDLLDELGFEYFYETTEYKYDNCFLTEKACRKHIEINGHNLKKPTTYLNHAYRNTEMETLFKFLLGLTGGRSLLERS